MPRIEINGLSIAYELIGDGDKAITITPGGRFSKDTPGVRELAQQLAGKGYKVLIWDRPNCGESDISFDAECESFQNADTLAGMIRALGLAPALVYGVSGGSREALLTAIRHPDCVAGVFCQWLSGGGIGIATLPMAYNANPAMAASIGGMEAVCALPDLQEQLERNPSNRDRLLAWQPEAFVRRMRDWADWFFPEPGQPISCTRAGDLEGIKVPVVVLRGGKSDMHHTRETSEAVAAMIPGAELQEPPWGDREWVDRLAATSTDPAAGLFVNIPKLVPQITDFASRIGHC
ncbi:MAG: alpha/beta hydrolase [Novosphingobium sp.]|nr:alpha/beta hydrolase [Novosphingobium sp.]MCP5402865.1 alpha/beta hydrolase [Novosphingobium sp.]